MPTIQEMRKKLAVVNKKISKLVTEKQQLSNEILKIEQLCVHNWSQPYILKGTGNRYARKCALCELEQKSKDIDIKF